VGRVQPVRPRRAVDTAVLVAVALCLGIALVRLAVVSVTVPAVYYASKHPSARLGVLGGSARSGGFVKRLASSPAASWWARPVPFRAGGDYLGVMTHHSTVRTLGSVLGVVVAQELASGADIKRVLVPDDLTALYGVEPGTAMVRTDGTVFRSKWAPPQRAVRFFTDVPVDAADYDPVLTAEQAATLESATRLTKHAEDFFVAEPTAGGSGTWALFARPGKPRQFLLVPVELAPAGGAL